MAVSETAHRPQRKGRAAKLWIALVAVIAAGVALAWAGAGPLRGETTASGVRIRIVEQGAGPFIQPMDGVVVDYEGRLTDGTVFDDSQRHGGPQPMIAGNVIPGFAEALGKMQKGGRYRIHIPGALAYGPNPPPGSPFGPNADLDFDVHVVQVVPNAALMGGTGSEASAQQPR
jgi:FKBP-type peptidyl-prolyl cis-trans isomerase FkpA